MIDMHQLILIEPDNRKLGWGVAKFVALLQDVEVNVDKDDSRSLHITIRQAAGSASPRRVALAAKFVFDDHIRCMAAKQRLTKGRTKARQRKMQQIAKLIELGALSCPTSSSSSSLSHNTRRSSSSSQKHQADAIPKSQSQEGGFGGMAKSNSGYTLNAHKPLARRGVSSALPGFAVADQGSTSSSRVGGLKKRLTSRRRSASSASGHSGDGSPRPNAAASQSNGLDTSEEIQMEDLSPRNDRRKNRSRSENRASSERAITLSQNECERV